MITKIFTDEYNKLKNLENELITTQDFQSLRKNSMSYIKLQKVFKIIY